MFNTKQGRDLNLGPFGWMAEILPLRQPRRRCDNVSTNLKNATFNNEVHTTHTYKMRHDTELVQRRLPIEQNNISIHQMALNSVSKLKNTRLH